MASEILKLTSPIEVNGKPVPEIEIHRPKVKDLRAIDKAITGVEDQFDQATIIASHLTGIPREAFEEVDAMDFASLSEVIARFLPSRAAPGGP